MKIDVHIRVTHTDSIVEKTVAEARDMRMVIPDSNIWDDAVEALYTMTRRCASLAELQLEQQGRRDEPTDAND